MYRSERLREIAVDFFIRVKLLLKAILTVMQAELTQAYICHIATYVVITIDLMQ